MGASSPCLIYKTASSVLGAYPGSPYNNLSQSGSFSDSSRFLKVRVTSPKKMRLHQSGKSVRFPDDMKDRVRPLPSNLRPLERINKKVSQLVWNDEVTQLVSHLERWDIKWRLYLQAFYDDQLNFVFPRSNALVADLVAKQKELQEIADQCQLQYAAVQRRAESSCPLSPARRQRHLMAAAVGEGERLMMRQQIHYNLLERMVTGAVTWRAVERSRWRNEMMQTTFCETVQMNELSQKKFKSASDSMRRMQKRLQKELDRSHLLTHDPLHLRSHTQSPHMQKVVS